MVRRPDSSWSSPSASRQFEEPVTLSRPGLQLSLSCQPLSRSGGQSPAPDPLDDLQVCVTIPVPLVKDRGSDNLLARFLFAEDDPLFEGPPPALLSWAGGEW